ncbi:MAG TPA: glycosyltransferase family 4 protein [Steroidobacteraceae bacterium]|nr:glycosyltransferase family 4 protein [Steroidobacteraceae bacterium]
MPHVAQVSFFLDPQGRGPEQMLEDWPSLVDVAEAAAQGGARVTVIQACASPAHLQRNGVDYHFVPPDDGGPTIACSRAFRQLVDGLTPDVIHVHGLGFPADVARVADLAPAVPILVQDHANRPPRFWRRHSWRRGLRAAAGVAFCAREQAEPFLKAGVLPTHSEVFEIPEAPARFTPGDRALARRQSGLCGDPCLLWVGHLDQNKDPLTVLRGVSLAVRYLPKLTLWCCFGKAPLLTEVREQVEQDPWLRDRVHLLGRVPHAQVEQLMRAADFFTLGSHREGSGYALAEALACGLPPVVTDIPSFRVMTGRGAVGWLWPRGDAQRLCEAILAATSRPQAGQQAHVRRHFERELSFDAVGRKLNAAYARLIASPASRVTARS